MNFSDKGPFENLPYTHVNIGFYPSDPPGFQCDKSVEQFYESGQFETVCQHNLTKTLS